LLEAFAQQAALVLDRVVLRAEAEQSKMAAESARLGKALLNSISHELRTPLAVITSATGNLAGATHGPGDLDDAKLAKIQEATALLNRLVENLLDATRLEFDHVRAKLDWNDVAGLIDDTVRVLGRELDGRAINVQLAEDLPLARLDFTLTQQALSNLLLNAAAHTPAGAVIEIEARHKDKFLELSVADNGPGLPPELLPKVFEKFFREPSAPAGGSGLGLAIVKGFIEAQGGQIIAANRSEGGAVFTIRLPQTKHPPRL
jgi:two-component system sensor histidine kinase KdpD